VLDFEHTTDNPDSVIHVPVSALNEFVYCHADFGYQHYHDEMGTPYDELMGDQNTKSSLKRGDGSIFQSNRT